ncbi:MAG: hypothetical protein ACOVLE_01460, partial [Pirellula staleyi]
MLKDVICKLDYSNFEEIALVLFGLCFLAVCWQAWCLKSDACSRFGSIPIDDLVPALVPAVEAARNIQSATTDKVRQSAQKEA